MAKIESMCGTCAFESRAASKSAADAEHANFDPAHNASWYAMEAPEIPGGNGLPPLARDYRKGWG